MYKKLLLKDKKVVVTGGSKGLGRAVVLACAKEGAQVAFTYAHDDAAATKTEQLVGSVGFKYKISATSLVENIKMAQELKERWGGIDILINNAGRSEFLPMALMEESDWRTTLDLNLTGAFITVKAFLPLMVAQKKGHVMNVGSLAGVRILAAPIDYSASKAGLKGFSEALAKEVGRYNIQVNCFAPGILDGGVAMGIPENKIRDYIDQLSIKRIATFDEAARALAFFVSDKNSYMSGATLIFDGGL
ncbi:MAG: hypothetical protein A2504_15580 [Bdellovibrionales bacterium RIFOXYD12_FULL_39_22]|nr:MAG: hypothetical protein A2385_03010 [Bdellovibrionales bacterium RIFOXYB1_FULL_39_21]OFZ43214.1 MAG: hypothetical protein A2485_12155 [Bdellovibrionales bacterium RIFOXYC12_FULL_39_17]OFZ47952.1 MAG: hypothetical protein A2404_16795 [Bdellovibrionales bacterium RIFOXYC1_FULL_39_130]OFZ73895.1 MAG: hypothetical protein A2451_06235 [Bdellovibrionales bacterium RIFOXYC2_FULL_39_8]OFZ75732.1 MAG: hypothetical protein A2560_13295 [Bdellovibrionales bacterium RIFOXYD1_FULL_39_84]OFZ94222.1 MAG: